MDGRKNHAVWTTRLARSLPLANEVGSMRGKIRFLSGEGLGKLVKRTAAEVSVRQIEIADDRCT